MTSRRRFLATLAGAGLFVGGCQSRGQNHSVAVAAGDREPSAGAPPVSVARNRVAIARNPAAVTGDQIDGTIVEALLDKALAKLSPAGDANAVWKALFRPSDTIAIKVNCLAGPPLSSHPELVRAIAKRLGETVGIEAANIIVYDRASGELQAVGFEERGEHYRTLGSDQVGYDDEPTVSGQAGSCYSRVVSELATAIVNVPVLKDHDLAGLSGALKNHFGSIHNPNKMHTDHCCPYVADVNCAPQIRDKHRLVVYDALLACYDGGPGYKPDSTLAHGGVMVASDPVAADAVAFDTLEAMRKAHGLPPIAGTDRAPRYIAVAADDQHRLGVADLKRIEVCEAT
jgi:uncharacterized protein (DUF362 family)